METQELIEKINSEYSFVEFYTLKPEIVRHLTRLIELDKPENIVMGLGD